MTALVRLASRRRFFPNDYDAAVRRHRRGEGSYFRDRTLKRWVAVYRGHKVYAKPNTEESAKSTLEDLRRRYGRSEYSPAKGSVDDYLRDWISTYQGIEPSTRVAYVGHINKHISPLIGSIPVSDLRPSDVRRMIATLTKSDLSASSVHRIHSTLHNALEQGVRERTLLENVAHGVSLPKPEERLIEAMTETDADAIRRAVEGTFLSTLVELLLGSGLRLGEALGLNQGDVHEGYVMLRRSKTRLRAVQISEDASQVLHQHIAALSVRGKDEPVFFGPRSGKRMNGSTVSHAFPKMLLDAGLARLTPHGTRHGAASMLLARGIPMKVVSEQLGHRSIQTTDKFYSHIAPTQLREAVSVLNRRKA